MSETAGSEGHVHRYHATCHWEGDTAIGYESYDRAHTSSAPPASSELMLSADPTFLGHPQKLNPEQLLLVSVSSCQLLSFLAIAARARVQVLEYDDHAEAEMPEDVKPMRLTKLTLRPRIVVGPGVKEERVLKFTELAHKQCYISNSLSTEVAVEPTVEIREKVIAGAGRGEQTPDPGNSSLSRDGDSMINESSREVEKDGLPGKHLAEGWRDLSGAKHPATKAVWAGEESYLIEGATQVPIVQSIPFGYDDIDEWMRVALGERKGHIYSRNTNPTTRAFEEKVQALEGAQDSTSFATGMAAISNTLFAFLEPGNRVVSVKDTYGGTNKVFLEFLPRAGVEVKLCDTTDPDAISEEIVRGCEVLYLETPTNPTLKLVDIGRLSEVGHEAGAVVVVDGTLATPINQSPLALGADLVLHSASKYLSGHADVLGGVLCGPGELVRRVYHYREINGAALDPFAAYLLIRGLKTLELRVTRHNENAMKVARFLEGHPAVERVFYPGLESHPQHELARRQMRGFGGMLSFSLVGGYEAVRAFLPRLQFAHRAANLGAVETTVGPPATTSHVETSSQEREAMGIPESLVRYSTGIEHPDDLISDLDNSLSATRAGTPNAPG